MTTPYASEAFLHQVLGKALAAGASDVHLKVGQPPGARVRGDLVYFRVDKIRPEDTEAAARILLGEGATAKIAGARDLVFAYEADGIGRFRVTLYRQRGSIALVLRSVPREVPTFAELRVPAAAIGLLEQGRGLLLIAGGAGQGKSSTLAAMVGHLNQGHAKHVVTIEDPIEHRHEDRRASVCQREVGADVPSLAAGVRAAARQDADVIMISDLPDAAAILAAIEGAEQGALVLAAIGAPDAARAVDRVIAAASDRSRVAAILQGVIAQRLLPKRDGAGSVLACEVLVATAAVREIIATRPDHAAALRASLEKGAASGLDSASTGENPHGMSTFEADIDRLVAQGLVSKAYLDGGKLGG